MKAKQPVKRKAAAKIEKPDNVDWQQLIGDAADLLRWIETFERISPFFPRGSASSMIRRSWGQVSHAARNLRESLTKLGIEEGKP